MRLIFLGSGEFGLPTLQSLSREHQVVGVVSQPDKPAGRHRQLTPTPVGQWALNSALPLLRPSDANQLEVIEQVRSFQADAGVVIAFGQKLSPQLVEACGKLVVNLHGSLLPRYRGAAPIQWAMIKGERETGVSVISLAQRMDAGLIYATASTLIDPLETAGELHDRLSLLGPEVVSQTLKRFEAGTLEGVAQDESQATRAPKLSKADGRINFEGSAEALRSRVHGLTPWPGVTVTWQKSDGTQQPLMLRRVASEAGGVLAPPGTVLEGGRVATGEGCLRLLEVQLPGSRVLSLEQFSRGHAMNPGDVLLPM